MTTTHTTDLPAALLEQPVEGLRLAGRTLGEVLGEGPTLLAFLRHFG